MNCFFCGKEHTGIHNLVPNVRGDGPSGHRRYRKTQYDIYGDKKCIPEFKRMENIEKYSRHKIIDIIRREISR